MILPKTLLGKDKLKHFTNVLHSVASFLVVCFFPFPDTPPQNAKWFYRKRFWAKRSWSILLAFCKGSLFFGCWVLCFFFGFSRHAPVKREMILPKTLLGKEKLKHFTRVLQRVAVFLIVVFFVFQTRPRKTRNDFTENAFGQRKVQAFY